MSNLKIEGKMRIFSKKTEDGKYMYSTSISSKNQNGEWERMYISVSFKAGTEIPNNTDIIVTNGFHSFFKDKNGLAHIKFVVLEYDTVSETAEDDIDLPF